MTTTLAIINEALKSAQDHLAEAEAERTRVYAIAAAIIQQLTPAGGDRTDSDQPTALALAETIEFLFEAHDPLGTVQRRLSEISEAIATQEQPPAAP
jgi:hypothetical protein